MTAKKRIGDNFLQKHEDLRIFNYIRTKKRAKNGQKQAKKTPEKRNFLAEKVIFSVAKPQKPLRQCSAKGGERKQKQPSTIKAGLSLF
ncbi:hypothetical protein [Hoylesella timonensis]|uniref:hypothetical protein n=1 Tax=Hoylesella timonensis TaxID=386414 RepID=UPI00040AAF28|nr:hypothetical protein [Hoylesella timonensis]